MNEKKFESGVPFIVKAYRVNHPFTRARNPQVVVESVTPGRLKATFACTDYLPFEDGVMEAYFVCAYRKNGQLATIRRVYRKGELSRV